MPTMFDAPACVGASRVKGPQVVLRQLRRLIVRNARTLQARRLTDDERRWSARVDELLARLIAEGDQVVTVRLDPKVDRRARKRR